MTCNRYAVEFALDILGRKNAWRERINTICKRIAIIMAALFSCLSMANDNYAFLYLHKVMAAYSDKVQQCDGKAVMPVLTEEETAFLQRVLSPQPLVLNYLAHQAVTRCTQPEYTALLELVVSYPEMDVSFPAKNLAAVTGKMMAYSDLTAQAAYWQLSEADRQALHAIKPLQRPFNVIYVFENIIQRDKE